MVIVNILLYIVFALILSTIVSVISWQYWTLFAILACVDILNWYRGKYLE